MLHSISFTGVLDHIGSHGIQSTPTDIEEQSVICNLPLDPVEYLP